VPDESDFEADDESRELYEEVSSDIESLIEYYESNMMKETRSVDGSEMSDEIECQSNQESNNSATSSSEGDSGSLSESDLDDTGSDISIKEGGFIVTSIANLRRREMHGIGSHLEIKKKESTKNKKRMPTKNLKQKRATLKETQALIGNEMAKDERNIKEKNPRKRSG
jgi:hypothetical protein